MFQQRAVSGEKNDLALVYLQTTERSASDYIWQTLF